MISVAALWAQVAKYRGWTYGAPAHYPSPLPGLRARIHPPGPAQTDCCSFVEGVVIPAAVASGGAEWGIELHHRAMIYDLVGDRFGPVDALVDAGLAELRQPHDLPAPWTVAQGWYLDAEGDEKGHTFIVTDVDAADGQVLLLEANHAYGLQGTGWRSLGPLGRCHETVELPTPPLWYRDPRCWTWGRVLNHYDQGLQVAALRVDAVAAALALGSPVPEREPEGGGSVRA